MTPPAIAAVSAPFGRDLDAAFARIERILRDARARGARMVVFPECALGGYLREPGPGGSAPDLPPGLDPDGREVARLVALAGDTVVCIGTRRRRPRAATPRRSASRATGCSAATARST